MPSPGSSLRAFGVRYAIALGVAIVFMIGAVVTVNYIINDKINSVARIDVKTAPAPPNGANYLLVGSDTRAFVKNAGEKQAFGDSKNTSGQRSDTMMVLHVEPEAKRTFVVSFPRDLWVRIPGVGMAKINAAFNTGPDKVIETLKANFGVDINHYLQVDFQSFQGIVRAIGSVPVYFPYPARDKETNLAVINPGCTRLDGPGALAYVRSRSLEYFAKSTKEWISADIIPDIGRIARQQSFIRSIASLAKVKGLNNPLTANEIVDRVLENLKIDKGLTKDNIFELIDAFRTIDPNSQTALDMETLPWASGPDQNGAQVLYPDQRADAVVIARLQDFSGSSNIPLVDPDHVTIKVLNGTGRAGVAEGAIAELKKLGFHGKQAGSDPRGIVKLTEVRYGPGAEAKGELMLSYLSPNARLVADSTLKGVDLAVVIGSDFKAILQPVTATTTTTAPTTTAPASAGTSATTTTTTSPGAAPIFPAPVPEPAIDSRLGDPAPRTPPC
jgi:LCP family protein required for cell wall assembly